MDVSDLQRLMHPMCSLRGPFLDKYLVVMELWKVAASLATNVFQTGFAKFFPLQTLGKIHYTTALIALIRHSPPRNVQQIAVSIATALEAHFLDNLSDALLSCQIYGVLRVQ